MKAPRGARLIPLTQGKFAIVDEDMFDELNKYKWFFHCGYARRNSDYIRGRKRHAIHMSRVVAKVPDGYSCDHISLNRCDNRRSNLRIANASENARNKRAYKNNTTGAKGVDFYKAIGRFRARIQVNKKPIGLGTFNTLSEAATAYSQAAVRYHGKFARIA